MLTASILTLIVSFLTCYLLVNFQHIHAHISTDHVASGPQKMHASATPRIGGLPVMLAVVTGMVYLYFSEQQTNSWYFLCSLLPVWLAGMTEDFTKKVSALKRLIAAFVSALVGMWLVNAKLYPLNIAVIDQYTQTYIFLNALITMIGVGGTTHSLNIIDGFNGLASGVTMMLLAVIAFVAYQVGDNFILTQSLLLLFATLGFFVWNFPGGKIFAGDGGAYLWGFAIAELLVLLVNRNPAVSPWFPVLVVIYPVWETVFSIYRRKFVRGHPVGEPDAIHLHSLIYRRLVKCSDKTPALKIRQNSMTSPYLWLVSLFGTIPALFVWNNSAGIFIFMGLFVLIYGSLYSMIVKFKLKSWMKISKKKQIDVEIPTPSI